MSKSGVLAGLITVGVILLIVLGAGTVFGVGPLAPAVPADKVTDPKEMIARSLQSTLDASAVHFDGTVSGSIVPATPPNSTSERPLGSVSVRVSRIRPKPPL